MFGKTTARALGLAGIGLGLGEIAVPKGIERLLGIGNGRNTTVLRTLGVREIGHGVDILTRRDPTFGVWLRVAGDVIDGVLMGIAGLKSRNRAGFAAACALVLGIAVADVLTARRLSNSKSS